MPRHRDELVRHPRRDEQPLRAQGALDGLEQDHAEGARLAQSSTTFPAPSRAVEMSCMLETFPTASFAVSSK